MTFLEMINNVFRLMRDNNQNKFDLDAVKQWINLGEIEYCNKTSFSVEKDETIITTSGTQEYTLPDDYKSIIKVFIDGNPITYTSIENTIEATTQTGTPSTYYIKQNQIGLYPVPNTTFNLTIIYYSIGGNLLNDDDVSIMPKEHQFIPIFYACYLASIESDDSRQNTFYNLYQMELQRAMTDNNRKIDYSNPSYSGVAVDKDYYSLLLGI